MIEEDILAFVSELDGVAVLTASEEGGAPEVAWGDSFFYYARPARSRISSSSRSPRSCAATTPALTLLSDALVDLV